MNVMSVCLMQRDGAITNILLGETVCDPFRMIFCTSSTPISDQVYRYNIKQTYPVAT